MGVYRTDSEIFIAQFLFKSIPEKNQTLMLESHILYFKACDFSGIYLE